MIVESLFGRIFNRNDGIKPFGSDIRYESGARSNARALLILDLNGLGDANGSVKTFKMAAEVWGALRRAYGGGVQAVAGYFWFCCKMRRI